MPNYRTRGMIVVASVLVTAGLGVAAPSDRAVLARRGTVIAPIVVSAEATETETTAARELAHYLEQATGAPFGVVVGEPEGLEDGPRIYVGATGFSQQLGLDHETMGSEEWIARVDSGSLVLMGGRPRGTLYAVYHFLEDEVGVRWWTPKDTDVPTHRVLEVGPFRRRGSPAFSYRDIYAIESPVPFSARLRLNGHNTHLASAFGGRIAFGPGSGVHTFHRYVSPEEWFERRPDFFSLREGRRTAETSQLCLTNPDLRALVEGELRKAIEDSRRKAVEAGVDPPSVFDVSQNDWGGACECDPCRAVLARTGSEAGAVLEFVNELAEAIRDDFPSLRVATLAYHYTLAAPESVRAADNVVVRFAALQGRDFAKPMTDLANERFAKALRGWINVSPHLWVWEYAVTFGDVADLPFPEYRRLATDLHFYHTLGVEGIFVQHDRLVGADLRDLEIWMLGKLLEDPYRDVDDLIQEFTDGYYGPAGRHLRRYLRLLERKAAGARPSIPYPVSPTDYAHLDRDFLVRAQGVFDRAEAAVSLDPVRLQRVRQARLSLDRAVLALWVRLYGESDRGRKKGTPFTRKEVADRYLETYIQTIDERLPEGQRRRWIKKLKKELKALVALSRGAS